MATRDLRKYHPSATDIINATEFDEEEEDTVNSKRKIKLNQLDRDLHKPPVKDIYEILDKTEIPPLEFYDNDDGYWDDYIKEKNRRRAQMPLPKTMPHYKL